MKATAGQEYGSLDAARERILELLHYEAHRKAYRKITEIAVDVVRQIEDEGHFPDAESGKFDFAEGQVTQGQRERKVVKEVLSGVIAFAQQALNTGKTQMETLDMLRPPLNDMLGPKKKPKEREFYNFSNLAGLFLHFLRSENSYIACYAPVFTP
ncbi:hypothetical protein [Candidatus Venteria ishoeyi]|uniref:Uncharacterized protein n=1 Tax=Candidatus Venteria ishoeyi TaxID=1899563 RepID=A0A1H6F4U6_9GAMM|nr:hypothetical protein [Candidatus Venteria ishoeyi]SEH05188.1 Uncharacterised protein [Candidatus Venteria ishoeyi]